MSLLLDALNRASKDKAAAAAVAVAETSGSKPGEPAIALPDLAPAAAWPTQGLSLAPTHAAPTMHAPHLSEERTYPEPVDSGMTLEAKPQPPAPPPPASQPETRTEAPMAPPPAPVLQPKLERIPPTGNKSTPGNAPRVAQEILRANAPPSPPPKSRMRLIILGGVAALLTVGVGSVLLGIWGNPKAWFQTGDIKGPSAQPAAMATAGESAAVTAAVAPQEVSSAPTQVQTLAETPESLPRVVKQPAKPHATAMAQPADRLRDECAPGLTQSECKAARLPRPVAAPGKSNPPMLQSRSIGPSALELGYAALTQGRLQEATQAYTQALAGNPEERDALLGLAYIAHQQGRAEDARGYYKRVLRQEPGNAVAKAGLLTLSPTDDAQELGSRSGEVAEQNPDSAAAQSVLGYGLVRQGRLADAQLAFYRAHMLEPAVALHAFNLAVALDRLHNYGPARLYYQRALALSAQSGGERASGVPHSVVQTRLEQLQAASATTPAGSP